MNTRTKQGWVGLAWAIMIGLGAVGCKPDSEVQSEIAQRESDRLAAEAAAAAKPAMPNQVAGVGVGVKGRSLEGGSEYNPATLMSGPAAAFFRTKEKIVFEIQLKKTVDLWVAEKGRYPKSHEEYMNEIIGKVIKLPELPKGMVYRYHPEDHELWVEAENTPNNDVARENIDPGSPYIEKP